uniref:RNA helicase n=1 Tax=Culicoides sonorensis TaxID=179676 RepID=A0A336MDX3_CULSO
MEYVLSWYINPHLFWLRSTNITSSHEFIEFEHKLDKYYKVKLAANVDFKVELNQMVVYNDRLHSKHYRAEVDYIYNKGTKNESYILWLTDYGFPVHAYKKDIRLLRNQFRSQFFGYVLKVGIFGVLPAKYHYDLMHDCERKEIRKTWSKEATDQLRAVLESSTVIKFTVKKMVDYHYFGKVIIETTNGRENDLAKKLLKSPYAVKAETEFNKVLEECHTIKIKRFQDNNCVNVFQPDNFDKVQKKSKQILESKVKHQNMPENDQMTHFLSNVIEKEPNLQNSMIMSCPDIEMNKTENLNLLEEIMENHSKVKNRTKDEIKNNKKDRRKSKTTNIEDPRKQSKILDISVKVMADESSSSMSSKTPPPLIKPKTHDLKTENHQKNFETQRFFDLKFVQENNKSMPKESVKVTPISSYQDLPPLEMKPKSSISSSLSSSEPVLLKSTETKEIPFQMNDKPEEFQLEDMHLKMSTTVRTEMPRLPNTSVTPKVKEINLSHSSVTSPDLSENEKQNQQNLSNATSEGEKKVVKKIDDMQNKFKVTNSELYKFLEKKRRTSSQPKTKSVNIEELMPAGYDQILSQDNRKHVFRNSNTDVNQSRNGANFTKHQNIKNTKHQNSTANYRNPITENYFLPSNLRAIFENRANETDVTTDTESSLSRPDQSELLINRDDFKPDFNQCYEEFGVNFSKNRNVLVHGKRKPTPINSYKETSFEKVVMREMKKQFSRFSIRRVQAYAWPHIIHENSAVIIGNHGAGKTWTLIPAICSKVIEFFKDDQIPVTHGPLAIVVAASADRASYIYNKVHKNFMSKLKPRDHEDVFPVVLSYGHYREDEVQSALLHGVGILIVTSKALERWHAKWLIDGLPLFNKERLKIFAVDDFDIIYNQCEIICDQMEKYSMLHKDANPTQFIITSSKWLPQLQKFTRFGKNPSLFIANYIEASIYGGTVFRLSFSTNENKLSVVEQFVSGEIYKQKRSLIIASNDEEVIRICEFLRKNDIKLTSFTQDTDEPDREAALNWYKNDMYTVLVCSDAVLGDLIDNLKNVERLLNYSLPDHWTTLSFRFCVFFESYHDYVKNSKTPQEYEKPFAQIMVDETSCHTLPKLVDFLKRIKANLPQEVISIANKMLIVREGAQASLQLCEYFLHFGIKSDECIKKRTLNHGRHALSEIDNPSKRMPPLNAVLKIHITHIHSPIHFSGQILAYRQPNTFKWLNWMDKNQKVEELNLKMQLQQYFNKKCENLMIPASLERGSIHAYQEYDLFYRVQILQISPDFKNRKCTLRKIDTGEILENVDTISLFALPDNLREIPARSLDFHRLGILPYDMDISWGDQAKKIIQTEFEQFTQMGKKDPDKEYFVKVNVTYRIKNHIWTDKMTLCEPLVDDQYHEFQLQRKLLKEKLAERVDADSQIEDLKEMSESLGFDNEPEPELQKLCPTQAIQESVENRKLEPIPEEPTIPKPRSTWDYLDQDCFIEICFSFLDDPSEFILNRIDKGTKMNELYGTIDKFDKSGNCKIKIDPKKGDNCLIPIDDGKARGRVINFGTDSQGKFVEVFSCDNGTLAKYDYDEIFETTKEIVEFMSYSAIMGSFAGIMPIDNESYTNDQTKLIWTKIENCQENGILYAKVVKHKKDLDWLPGIYRYELILISQGKNGEFKILNKELVEEGIAKYDETSKEILKELTPEIIESQFKGQQDEIECENTESDDDWEKLVGTGKKIERNSTTDSIKDDTSSKGSLLSALDKQSDEDEKLDFFTQIFKETGIHDETIAIMEKLRNETKNLNQLKAIEPPKSIHETVSTTSTTKSQLKSNKTITKNSSKLIFTTPQSQILWQDNTSMVILSIKIDDNQDFHLEVHNRCMIFVHYIPEQEPRVNVINLFGQITTENVSHQIRGLNLIIRLAKSAPGLLWPRLHKEHEKHRNIQYNIHTMNPLESDFELVNKRRKQKLDKYSDDSASDFDSVEEAITSDDENDDSYDDDPLNLFPAFTFLINHKNWKLLNIRFLGLRLSGFLAVGPFDGANNGGDVAINNSIVSSPSCT